jgi:hypothetical protein
MSAIEQSVTFTNTSICKSTNIYRQIYICATHVTGTELVQ